MRGMMAALIVTSFVASACDRSGAPTESLRELAKARAGDLDVVLLTADTGVSTGKDSVTIEFRGASDGRLVDVGTVRAHASMQMAGMAPMVGPVDIERSSVPGTYLATSDLSMAGEWRVSLEWNGPAGEGSVRFSLVVN